MYNYIPHRIHVWYICLHLTDFYGKIKGKHTRPMNPVGSETSTSVLVMAGFLAESFLKGMVLQGGSLADHYKWSYGYPTNGLINMVN